MARVYQKGVKAIVCAGRRAGKPVEVIEVLDNNFVKIRTAKGKERKMNVAHLRPA